MSGNSVGKIFTQARLPAPASPSGTKISKSELKDAWTEALRPEAADPAGKPVQQAEGVYFKDLKQSEMTSAAWKYLQSEILPKMQKLLQGEAQPVGPNTPISPPSSNRPVFVNADGWAVPLADTLGQPALSAAEEGLYRLALLVSQTAQNGKAVKELDALPMSTRAKLADNLISLAKQSQAATAPLPGLDADETAQLRSSAFSALWYLAKDLKPSGTTAQLQGKIHGALVQLADKETHKWLGKHEARMLDRPEYRKNLSADQAKDVKEIFEARHPQKFDVGNLLDNQGFISWEHLCGEGENFFASMKLEIEGQSIGGAKFVKKGSGSGYQDYELKFDPPRGENGRVKGVRVRVAEYHDDMYGNVGKKKGFSYGGHSDIGENQERSMVEALAKGLKANKPQLAVLDLCAGLDNLDDALEKLGDLEVLTTFGSSYFWKGTLKDEFGNEFEGVRKSEGTDSLIAIWESLSKEEAYEPMRERVKDAIYSYAHLRNPNVVFPTLEDYREVRWMHLDGDGDGRMDANDLLYQFGLRTAQKDTAKEFVLKDNGPADELSGEAPKNAVLDLNVASHYNTTTEGNSAVEHKFNGAGYYESSDAADLVRFNVAGTNHDGSKVIDVSFNSGLAHTTREALEGLAQYSAIVNLADQGVITGLTEVERKLMGLTFAAFRLNYDGQSRQNDQRVWKQLLDVLRLPSDLPYGPLATLLDGEEHNYSGSIDIVNQYKAELSAATIKKLEAKGVGRPGVGAPS